MAKYTLDMLVHNLTPEIPLFIASVTADDGSAVNGLQKSHFVAFQVAYSMTGLSSKELKIGDVQEKTDGVYVIFLESNWAKGIYVVSFSVTKWKGWSRSRGQSIMRFSMGL